MGAFPAAKLAALLIRQLSKPIANYAKEKAKKNFVMRNYICMPPAQFYHWCEIKLKTWSGTKGQPIQINKVSEQEAIELGANMLGEAIIFIVASIILVAEYSRQKEKEAAKEKAAVDELKGLHHEIGELQSGLKEMNRLISSLQAAQELRKTVETKPVKTTSNPGNSTLSSIPLVKAKEEKTAISVTCIAPVPTEPKVIKDETNNQREGVIMKAVSHLVKV